MIGDGASYRAGLPPRPQRIAERLPLNERGYPVPWFVAWLDEEGHERPPETPGARPDFRVIGEGRIVRAYADRLCWICGERLGALVSFVIGPMCAINRVSSEPPSHTSCAEYAAIACPFLSMPKMERRENAIPPDVHQPAGHGLKRNPGVALVWTTKRFYPFRPPGGGILFNVGVPHEVAWYAEGRPATFVEVAASVASGYPTLLEMAVAESSEAVAELEARRAEAEKLYPAVSS